jgi:Cu(I)/Ag(I) efflux system membrane fusion protein/cobalt-zinc-cadmium efflux system membrane fusion protein
VWFRFAGCGRGALQLARRMIRKSFLVIAMRSKSAFVFGSAIVLVAAAVGFVVSENSAGKSAVAETSAGGTESKQQQLWTCGMHPQVFQDHPGACPICHMKLVPMRPEDEGSAGGEKKIAYWWDPMLGPSSITDHPGKSAMGMDLVPVYESTVSAGPSVRIDPTVVQNMGVTTAAVVRGPLSVTVRVVGMLDVPEPGAHDVTVKINGYIQKLYADTDGMSVARGDVLFDLYSPDLQVAEQELIAAEQSLKAFGSGAGEAAGNDARNLIESAKQKLRLWDIADRDIDAIAAADRAPKTVPFRSPVGGHIVEKAVVEGSAVQAGMKVMRIEDHSKLWLNAQVYEEQIPLIEVGQEVRASVAGVPGKVFTGKVSFIYPHLDHMARTEMVRTVLDNPGHELKPGMYATVEIVTRPVADAVIAPREAVIDTGAQQIAFVLDPVSAGHFQPRKVRMGIVGDDDRVQIVEGLSPGDQVVTSGQFLMDVESRTAEAIEKLRSGGATTMPSAGTELMHPMSEGGGRP